MEHGKNCKCSKCGKYMQRPRMVVLSPDKCVRCRDRDVAIRGTQVTVGDGPSADWYNKG